VNRAEKRILLLLPKPLPVIIAAPGWLKNQMERVRRLPPPTLEEVRLTWAAVQRDSIQQDLDDKIAKGIPIR